MAAKTKMKLNGIAESTFRSSLAQLVESYGFSQAEASCETMEVLEEKVVFRIHERLKNLLEDQLNTHKPRHAEFTFEKYDKLHWLVIIEADGVESFFFARRLAQVIEKLESEIREKISGAARPRYIKVNMTLLKKAFAAAITKAGGNPKEVAAEIAYADGKDYVVTFTINKSLITFRDHNIDELFKTIAREVPTFYSALCKQSNSPITTR